MFPSSIISIITITLVAYLFCKHKHIRTILASLILHKIKHMEANSNHNPEINNCEYRTLAHIGIILTVLIMIIVMFFRVSHWNKSSEFTLLTCTTFVPRPKKVKKIFSKFLDTILIPPRPLKFATI